MADQPEMTDAQTLQTVDADGDFVESRIGNPAVFRLIYDNLCANDAAGAKERVKLRAARDGAPPFNKQLLIDSGQAYRNNINDGGMASNLNKRDAAIFALLFNTESLIRTKFLPGTFGDLNTEKQVSTILEKAYSTVFRGEERLIEGAQRVIRDSHEAGVGFPVFVDADDWRYKGVRRARVTFNNSATTEDSTMELFYVADTMIIADLYDLVKDPESAEDLGWNIEALQRALVDFFRDQGADADVEFARNFSTMWDSLETRILSNDPVLMAEQYNLFSVVRGWVSECNGGVTHYIVPYYQVAGETDFIFSKANVVENMGQVVCPLPYNAGDGELRSVKGLAYELYPLAVTSNRQLNATFDSAGVSGSFVVQQTDGSSNLENTITRAGPFTYLAPGLTPMNQAFAPKLDSMLAARSVVTQQMQANTGVITHRAADSSQKDGNVTAAQIRSEDAKEVQMEEDRLALLYLRYDKLHAEGMRRLLDSGIRGRMGKSAKRGADRFVQICEAEGLSKEDLGKLAPSIIVKTTRSVGGASPAARLQNLMQGKQLTFSSMDEAGKREVDREMAIIIFGHDNVDRFVPALSEGANPSGAASFQELENHDILEGTECLVTRDQEHYTHATTCGAMLMQYAQAFSQAPQQMEEKQLIEMGNAGQFGIAHFVRHLEYLKLNPLREAQAAELEQFLEQLIPVYQQAAQVIQQLREQQEKERQQLEQENAAMKQQLAEQHSSMAIEQYKAEANAKLKFTEAQWLNESRKVKTETAANATNMKAMQAMQRDMSKFQQEQMRLNAETNAKIERMVRESQAKVGAQNSGPEK